MKKLFCFLFTLLLLITLQSTAFAQDQAEVSTEKIDTSAWVTYKIKELGMSINLPSDMKVYTRESIKKGNVEEDENFDAICKDFEHPQLFLKSKNGVLSFTLTVSRFYNISSIIWPNLFTAEEPAFDNFLKIYNKYSDNSNYTEFTSSYGKFISSADFNIETSVSRIFSHYESNVNYQSIIISFNTYQDEIPFNTQDVYDEIIRSIQFDNYRFNFLFLVIASSIFIVVILAFRVTLKFYKKKQALNSKAF